MSESLETITRRLQRQREADRLREIREEETRRMSKKQAELAEKKKFNEGVAPLLDNFVKLMVKQGAPGAKLFKKVRYRKMLFAERKIVTDVPGWHLTEGKILRSRKEDDYYEPTSIALLATGEVAIYHGDSYHDGNILNDDLSKLVDYKAFSSPEDVQQRLDEIQQANG